MIFRIVVSLLLCGLSFASQAESFDLDRALESARSRCGYDLTDIKPRLTISSIKKFDPDGIQLKFNAKISDKSKVLIAQMTISCAGSSINPMQSSDDVPDAQAVIQNEDAGSRYFRHVASQTVVNGRNWRANVAVVDYLLADAQRIEMTEIVVCNADTISPCIFINFSKPRRLSKNHQKLVYSMIEKVVVVRPTGK